MSANIYSISSWATTTRYEKNDIVISNSLYYYANSPHISSAFFATDLGNNLWGGRIVADNGEAKKHFIWKPAYNHPVDNQPKIKKIQFSDGYVQRIPDGISNILPVFNLEFECDLQEVTAILHFLENCKGVESFVWLPPAPRGNLSRWVCEQWSDAQPFYNNYKIQAKFERSVV